MARIPELQLKLSHSQGLSPFGSQKWSELAYADSGGSIDVRFVLTQLDREVCTLGGRGDHYLSRRRWHLLQDHSYGGTSRREDTVPENSLFLYSPHHPAETCLHLHRTGPRQGLRGHARSSAAGIPRQRRAYPSGRHKPCPTGRGGKLPHVQSICLTHSLVVVVASLLKIQKILHIRRSNIFCSIHLLNHAASIDRTAAGSQ